ncbi:protein MEMO1 isoform X2 [Tribolium castaneum]|uniref:Protein MEMO1-like Protein n=1 Tax=Tribolium castaneum TaxID=7070 RepID=A0A139WJC4_TRICA|nr:PREDICTED: protein MEMO1-like isoform X4 [Tribolium castaneum]KYB28004.1 Protein MEMO1-like Protein [Tribolium castaneum]|eukprot:XP_015834517.1 PREDICTED: protein MEMO1-like isoform X4 [Tribolium castaneum]
MPTRKAKHAGSWYSDSEVELSNQLGLWLQKAKYVHGPARALIAPHAGYKYCGSCSAWAYRQVMPEMVKKIFILGPSHHFGLSGCALTTATYYKTPLYDLLVDSKVNSELQRTGQFELLDLNVDEKEHSIEMQLPYVAKVMECYKDQFTIVPILVGTLSAEKHLNYGKIFVNYLKDPENLFIISSDFCHWGSQFRYTYYDRSYNSIYESIHNLDLMGMNTIENLNPTEFSDYLKQYGNTICGRHVIGILLHMVQNLIEETDQRPKLKFLKYAQSNQCVSMSDSSVSYAAAALTID